MKRLTVFLATVCALSLFGWLAHAQQSCRGWQDYECTDGFASYWVATPAPPAIASGNNGVLFQETADHNIEFLSDFGTATYGMQAQSCGTSPQTFMTESFTNGSFTCQQVAYASVSGTPVACTDFVHLPCQGGTSDIGGTDANTTVLASELGFFHRGWDEYFQQSPPVAPTGTKVRVWNGTTGAGIQSEDASLVNRYMAKDVSCSGGTPFATGESLGATTCGAPAVTCAELPATAAGSDVSRSAGSCAESVVAVRDGLGTRWPFSGTFANGDVFILSAGDIFAASTISCTNLPAFSGGAVTSTGGTCALTLDGPSVAAASTKMSFSLQLQLSNGIPNTWLLQGGAGLFTNGALIEYPNDFKAGHITIKWYLRSNVITAGNLAAAASLNGTGIGGSGTGNINSTTTTGVHTIGPVVTGSTSASDTYGLFFTTDASYAATSPTSVFLTFEVVLTP